MVRDLGENATLMFDFGVDLGSANAMLTVSSVCVHEYGGGVGGCSVTRASSFSSFRGMGASSSGAGS
jgi:hypothetical protein